jgi:aryl-alcohol dehydrogenase-like predicted oxidoreductase
MHTRAIPGSGEMLPVIGCGTYVGFDRSPGSPEFARLGGVLGSLFAAGGSVVDSSPMYGKAEASVGHLLALSGERRRAFLATKVWTTGRAAGIRQMEESLRLLQSQGVDLLQIHNLVDWRNHLPTLRDWKRSGRVRYIGITHYTSTAYDDVEVVLRAEPLDFLQINYSMEDRAAARRLLPLAAERGVAVLVNMPFGGGRLLRRLRARPLPPWAAEIGCTSWPQVLLKFVLGHPAVTCAIPGTGDPAHMAHNAQAGHGTLPEAGYWADKLDALTQ